MFSKLIIVLMGLAFLLMLYYGVMDSQNEEYIDSPFDNEWKNTLYKLSYSIPFSWFIDDKERSPKTKELKENLFFADMNKMFNYRSFTVMKSLIFLSSFIIFFLLCFIIENYVSITNVLFNLNQDATTISTTQMGKFKIYVFMILMIICLLPNLYIKHKANNAKYAKIKDLPVIQLFITLMLRSKRPLGEILFTLSKLKTKYRDIFNVGYRKYIRDKKEGINYLYSKFDGTKFQNTIKTLRDLDEYSKEDTIKILENNMEEIESENKDIQKKQDIKNLLISQVSLILPFLSIILLGFAPIVALGISIFQQSGIGF